MRRKQEGIITRIVVILVFISFPVLAYLGFRYFNVEDINDSNWGLFALLQSAFVLTGFFGSSLLTHGQIFPQKLKKVELETITRAIIITLFIVGIQILTSLKLSVSSTEKALYYVFAAIGEELFFRAFLLELMKKFNVNKIVSVFVSAGLFAAIHINYYGDLMALLSVFLGGLLLAVFYILYRDITANILAHLINNLIAVGFSFLTVSFSSEIDISIICFSAVGMIVIFFLTIVFFQLKKIEKVDNNESTLITDETTIINRLGNKIMLFGLMILLIICVYFIYIFGFELKPIGGW